jgi:hypothetical protein
MKDRVRVGNVVVPPGGGFVVIYRNENGVPGVRAGSSNKLAAGEATGTMVDASGDDPVWVIVHRDVDGDATLRFPGPDVPVVDETGAVVSVLVAPDSRGDPPP